MNRLSILAMVITTAFALSSEMAEASSFVLNIDHCTGGCGTAPFGTVTLGAGTGAVDVDVALANISEKFLWTGFDGSFGFNLVGNPTIGISNLTFGWTIVNLIPGSDHFDGFGRFEYAVQWGTHGGGAGTPGPLHFTVNASGLTAAKFEETSIGGDDSVFFAADILGATGRTGPVGGSCAVGASCAPTTVPEPASMLLLGTGLLSAGFFRRRRK